MLPHFDRDVHLFHSQDGLTRLLRLLYSGMGRWAVGERRGSGRRGPKNLEREPRVDVRPTVIVDTQVTGE